MNWKDYLTMLVSLIAPVLWTMIKDKNPDFPMPQQVFVDTVVYIFMSILGTRLMKLFIVLKLKKKDMTYESLVS